MFLASFGSPWLVGICGFPSCSFTITKEFPVVMMIWDPSRTRALKALLARWGICAAWH